jgi:periplasmic mercuric ion binding protein
MKTAKSIFTAFLLVFLTWSCKEKISDTAAIENVKTEIKAENLQKTSFTVEGMTCAVGCAKTIQQELSALNGVEKAIVNFEKKLAVISFDKTVQTPESLLKVVESVGDGKTYTVSKL